MQLTLLCERCRVRGVDTKIGVFEYAALTWPIELSIFKSWSPENLPDPYPVGRVDDWTWARCRMCGSRPFLNIVPQPDGRVMIVTGERIKQGLEGRVLTLEKGYVPIPGYPGGPEVVVDTDGDIGQVVAAIGPPYACPDCGQEYKARIYYDRFHNCKLKREVSNG